MKSIKTMKTKFFILLLFSVFLRISAQEKHIGFPRDQHKYLGGMEGFYKDFHKILIDKKLKPCDNKKEFYHAPVLIKSFDSVELLENKSAQENKCSFELTKEVLKYMDNWMPAKIDGIETPAVAVINIYPDDLFDNYKEGYNFFNKDYESSDFDIDEFRKKIANQISLDNFNFKGSGKLTIVTSFIVNTEGRLEKLRIEKSSGSQRFDEMVMDAIKRTQKNKTWKPAKTHGMLINTNFSFPLTISVR
ncbi:energy transducer TonB [Epilithonimonas mollis]|nr:energy transducer TonB [Epilithonimonas mollis]